MNGNTVATLHQLFSTNWFSNAGKQDTTSERVLASWDAAAASCSSPAWDELQHEAASRYRERLAERSRERLRHWNKIVDDVGPTVQELVRAKTDAVVANESLPPTVVRVIEWDMLHLCMESEFGDVFPPGFYAAQAYWYTVGHFPCGWDGEFPTGTRVIF